jgi:RNA polymerase sigma-70 factor (ECF subfamily)
MIMDITQLVAQCRTGDPLAVEQLIQKFQPMMYRLAISILDDAREAEEATQDALFAALQALNSYRGEAAFTTWLYAITLNLCLNRLRARHRRSRVYALFQGLRHLKEERAIEPEEMVIQRESSTRIFQTVQSLDEKHRLPVILRYYHDCSVDEIAQILDIPPGTVHSRLNSARQKLKHRLSESH